MEDRRSRHLSKAGLALALTLGLAQVAGCGGSSPGASSDSGLSAPAAASPSTQPLLPGVTNSGDLGSDFASPSPDATTDPSASPPASSSPAASASPAASPAPVTLSAARLSFPRIGTTQTLAATQSGFSGPFTASTCTLSGTTIATVAPKTGGASFDITSAAVGSCTITVSGQSGQTATVQVRVMTTIIQIQ